MFTFQSLTARVIGTWLRDRFQVYLDENGKPTAAPSLMKDGWAVDHSCRLPHLQQLLADSAMIIQEGGLKPSKPGEAPRAFFQNILKRDDLEKYPSILNFILSSEVLTVVCHYLQTIPILSTTEAALKIMSKRKLEGIFVEPIKAAEKRSRELSGN